MKFILDVNGVKRAFEAPAFTICASRRDMLWLRQALKAAEHDEFSYGWIDVHEPAPVTTNTPPITWEQPATEQKKHDDASLYRGGVVANVDIERQVITITNEGEAPEPKP